MKNLVIPKVDPDQVLYEIINSKKNERKQRLTDRLDFLYILYTKYFDNRFNLGFIEKQVWSNIDKEDLCHCYISSTEPLKTLKFKILDAQPNICRHICHLCNSNSLDNEFDHYLPKELFPEYSAYAFNIMPCCSKCNQKKSKSFLNKQNKRQFLHLYFDTIPQERFLNVEIELCNKIPVAKFFLIKNSEISTELFEILSNHFTSLALLDRYTQLSPSAFSEIAISIAEHQLDDIEKIGEFLANQCNVFRRIYSNNHWKLVLYEHLIDNYYLIEQLLEIEYK